MSLLGQNQSRVSHLKYWLKFYRKQMGIKVLRTVHSADLFPGTEQSVLPRTFLGFILTLSFPLDSAEVFCRGSQEMVKGTECTMCDLV